MPMITEMPPLQKDDESVVASRAAVASLKNNLEDTKTQAEEDEQEPALTFEMAQPRSTFGGKAPHDTQRSGVE